MTMENRVSKPRKGPTKGVAVKKVKRKSGPKERLTLDLARRIVTMIGQFPDIPISVTWENILKQVKLRFGHDFRRNVLSQKSWDGRKLISDAYDEAKEIERSQARDVAPKYANEPRSRLREVVAKLQAENLALREQLAKVRAAQYDEIHSLLDLRTPMHRAVALRADTEPD